MPNGEEMNDRHEEEAPVTINRREAIWRVGVLLGGVTFIGGTSLLTACEKGHQSVASGANVGDFTPDDMAFLDEVADTILPTTSTPGAKAAKVGPFIAVMVTDCYDAKEQKIFRDGMKKLDDASKKANNNASFVSLGACLVSLPSGGATSSSSRSISIVIHIGMVATMFAR